MGSLANYRSRRQVRLLCIFPNCLLSKHGVLLVFLSFLILILIRGISNKNLELQVHFLKLTQRRSLYFHWVTDVFPTEFPCLQLCSLQIIVLTSLLTHIFIIPLIPISANEIPLTVKSLWYSNGVSNYKSIQSLRQHFTNQSLLSKDISIWTNKRIRS